MRSAEVIVAALAVVAAGCTTKPASAPRSDAPCGGSFGPTAPWCTEADFPGTLPPATPEAVRAVADAVAAACPQPTADDPTPGLSPTGRWAADHHLPRWVQSRSLLRTDCAGLERFLAALPAEAPDRARKLDRLAQEYAHLELVEHEECRELTVPTAPGSYEFAQIRDHALDVVQGLREGREGARRTCALLRRDHPDHGPAVPCPR